MGDPQSYARGMTREYNDGQLELQERFDSRRLADLLAGITTTEITDELRRFIEARDMFFLATADADGRPECSYKGGEPGFVRVLDTNTLAFPIYDGNGMFLSAGNLGVNPNVGMLFIDFTDGTRLRVNGTATIDHDDPLMDSWNGASFIVRVTPDAVFANCRRYVHKYELVERSTFVPKAGHVPPVPDWKIGPWIEEALPHDDPARDPGNPIEGSIPNF